MLWFVVGEEGPSSLPGLVEGGMGGEGHSES